MSKKLKSDLDIGTRFGRLVVKQGLGGRPRRFICVCDCGAEKNIACYELTSGKTQSCGCLKNELLAKRRTTHGMRSTREYKAWAEAKQRCHNPKSRKYKWYGARGISVCQEWMNDFPAFYEHIGPCPEGYELDRERNNEGYLPGNVRWVPHSVNSSNRRNSINVSYKGEVMKLREYCDIANIKYATAWLMMKQNRLPESCVIIRNDIS